MKNPLQVLAYAALQGIFLPLILWIDDLRGEPAYWLVFAFYELLVTLDALLYWVIFIKEQK